MLLLSLSGEAGSEVVEVVSPTKAEGLEVPGIRKESDFSCSYQGFKLCGLRSPICLSPEDVFSPTFSASFPIFSNLSVC